MTGIIVGVLSQTKTFERYKFSTSLFGYLVHESKVVHVHLVINRGFKKKKGGSCL